MDDTGWIAYTPFNASNDDNECDWNYLFDGEIYEYEDVSDELEVEDHGKLVCTDCNSDIPEYKSAYNVDDKIICLHCFDHWIKQFRHEHIKNPCKVDLYGVISFKLN